MAYGYGGGGRLDFEQILRSKNFTVDQYNEIQNLSDWGMQQMTQIIEEHDDIKALKTKKEALLSKNRLQADDNFSKKDEFETKKQRLLQLRQEHQYKVEQHASLSSSIDAQKSDMNLDSAKMLLQVAQSESEEKSEEVANSFLNDDINISKFLKSYIAEKSIAHQRKTKVEELQKMMDVAAAMPATASRGHHNQQRNSANTTPRGGSPMGYPGGHPGFQQQPPGYGGYPGQPYGGYPAPRRPAPGIPNQQFPHIPQQMGYPQPGQMGYPRF